MPSLSTTFEVNDRERQPLLASADLHDAPDGAVARSPTKTNIQDQDENAVSTTKVTFPYVKFCIAWVGVFLASADSGLVLATYSSIASDLQELQYGAWLITGYTLGYSIALPAYGAVSDIFGRKPPLLLCYALFGIGSVISGVGPNLVTVIVGRIIQGVGGAGTTAVVTIIITDLAPISKAALLRSYINLAAIVGRGAGGPIGGLLFDTIGWRLSFLLQAPIIALCLIAAETQTLPPPPGTEATYGTYPTKKKRHLLDIPGLCTFAVVMTSFLLLIDSAAKGMDLADPSTFAPLIVFVFSVAALVWVEVRFSTHPLLAPALFKQKGVVAQYLMQALLLAAQFTVLSNIPTYFIRTTNASSTLASLTILPAPVGNALGSYIAGLWIQRYKTYLPPIYLTCILSPIAFAIMLVRWSPLPVPGNLTAGPAGVTSDGTTASIPISMWECAVLFPAAFSLGLTSSAGFVGVGVCADMDDEDGEGGADGRNGGSSGGGGSGRNGNANGGTSLTAMAVSVFFLSQQVGMIIGASAGTGVARMGFEKVLRSTVKDESCIQGALCDARFAWKYLPPGMQRIVSVSYAQGYMFVSILALVCAVLAIPLVMLMPKRKIE